MGMPRLRTLAAFTLALCMTLPVAAATVTVGAGGNLQLAIDNAAPGDTILLQAGATFTGNFLVRGHEVVPDDPLVSARLAPAFARAEDRPRIFRLPPEAEIAELRLGADD